MFHLFTLQGKQIDAKLEHLPENIRVHHVNSKNRAAKFVEGEPSGRNPGIAGSPEYAADAYKDAVRDENIKTQVFHASEIMSSPVITTGTDVPARSVWLQFRDKNVHHIPVISDNGKLIGIVSDRDISSKLVVCGDNDEPDMDITVKEIMSTDVIATSPLTDIRRIAKAMLDNHIGAMPVIDENGTVAGIITRSDILYAIIHQPDLKLWA